jgi:hypothetical protein
MGAFAHGVVQRIAGPRYVPRRLPLALPGHNHGTARPCRIRCGVNEVLYVLNAQAGVSCVFTDSLIGCVQVVVRNDTATMICHVNGAAPQPDKWVAAGLVEFTLRYGAPTQCYAFNGDGNGPINRIYQALGGNAVTAARANGYAIDLLTGNHSQVPLIGWGTNQQDVGGWNSTPDLIDFRQTDPARLGDAAIGDHSDGCARCNAMFG